MKWKKQTLTNITMIILTINMQKILGCRWQEARQIKRPLHISDLDGREYAEEKDRESCDENSHVSESSQYQDASGSTRRKIDQNSVEHSLRKGRVWDKKDRCAYCDKDVTNFSSISSEIMRKKKVSEKSFYCQKEPGNEVDDSDERSEEDEASEQKDPNMSDTVGQSKEANEPEADDFIASEEEATAKKKKKYKPKPKKEKCREICSKEQKSIMKKFFKTHIEEKMSPKKDECLKFQNNHRKLFDDKTWVQIKVFIYNTYKNK
ncbi:hypothetical protein JTB14_036367 [Gonioctena quinquepunctata]|nr:hypothetical protein JTB14_036367 [Gonioctena quinquepunctata]